MVGTVRQLWARLFVAAVAIFLVTPAIVQVLTRDPAATAENRRLASWPAAPQSFAEALELPSRIDGYIQDHFGLRTKMISAHNRLRYALFGELPSQQVVKGHSGRVFLASHLAATPFELIHAVCGVGVKESAIREAGQSNVRLISNLRDAAPQSLLLIVPTAPAIYPEELPDWLGRQCARAEPTALRVAASLPIAARAAWVYPLEEERRLKQTIDVYPRTHFHWLGTAPRLIVEAIAEQRLGLVKHAEVPATVRRVGSDLNQFLVGLSFASNAAIPDWQRTGIEACSGSACFPELGEIAPLLDDVSRYRTPNINGKKILVLSDSFGLNAAGYFSQYAREVQHFSINNIERLSSDQLRRFKMFLFREDRPDIVVAIYHDGALLSGPRNLNGILWPDDTSDVAAAMSDAEKRSLQ